MASAVSCTKDPCVRDSSAGNVSVRFVAENPATRGESDVNSLSGFVFRRSDGRLLGSGVSGGTSITMEMPSGVDVRYCILANAHASGGVDTVTSYGSFLEVLSRMKELGGDFEMKCEGDGAFGRDTVLDIALERLASKITVKYVRPEFIGKAFPESRIVFHSAFLTNAPVRMAYGGDVPSDGWCNTLGRDPSLDAVLAARTVRDYGIVMNDASGLMIGLSLYCYPNKVDNGLTSEVAPAWSPRNTRLVLRLDIDGTPNYYPITLGAMESNVVYQIENVIITGPGSYHPDIPVKKGEAISYTVNVTGWVDDPIEVVLD